MLTRLKEDILREMQNAASRVFSPVNSSLKQINCRCFMIDSSRAWNQQKGTKWKATLID